MPWRAWSLDDLSPDWGPLRSAYHHIRTVSPDTLPDDVPPGEDTLRWAPGAMDGVMGSHGSEDLVANIFGRLTEALARIDDDTFGRLYEVLKDSSCLDYVDPLIERIDAHRSSLDFDRLRQLALFLAMRAPHREPVKAGLALLGCTGNENDLEVMRILARHDEFSVYAALAAARVSGDPETTLWEMAKAVHGWGRIQIVSRLAETERRDIRAWMLREGFRNYIMDEYLACTCARAGRLHEALAMSPIDRPLLDGAAGILRALIASGPAEGIDDYDHAPQAIERYVNHAWAVMDLGLEHFLALRDVRTYLAEERAGWSEDLRSQVRFTIDDILHRDKWLSLVERGLASHDRQDFWKADQAARELGIDTWAVHFARVKAAPIESSDWYYLMEETAAERVDEVLSFAESALPLADIASGPTQALGLGPGWAAHSALDWVLQGLRRFPEKGWTLIAAGLRSPVVRNRATAIGALLEWPRESWPADAEGMLRDALAAEPDEGIREEFEKLMKK